MRVERKAALAALAMTLGGCSLAPAYHPVKEAPPAQFAETPPGWAVATPADATPRGPWWQCFADPVLDDLENRSIAASPTLAAALARHDEALASLGIVAGQLLPEIDAVGSAEHARAALNRPDTNGVAGIGNDFIAGGQLSYEVDLWGRVRNSVAAARDEASASASDLAAARLSLAAGVADAYVRLRGLDARSDLLVRTVNAYSRALDLTSRRHRGGIDSGLDENRARTILGNAQAQVDEIASQRAATEHEIAALIGAVASDFHIAPVARPVAAPPVPTGTPSALIQRRPDIAAAERRMAEANARIGVSRAALFPTVTLGMSVGQETTGPAFLSAQNTYWGLGPLQFSLPVFDGGRRHAQVRLSRAQYAESAANYRNAVLTGFREVEDALAAARHLAAESANQKTAARAAQATNDLAFIRYREGAADYLQVVTAQTDLLNAQEAFLDVETRRAQSTVALVRALGGPVG